MGNRDIQIEIDDMIRNRRNIEDEKDTLAIEKDRVLDDADEYMVHLRTLNSILLDCTAGYSGEGTEAFYVETEDIIGMKYQQVQNFYADTEEEYTREIKEITNKLDEVEDNIIRKREELDGNYL